MTPQDIYIIFSLYLGDYQKSRKMSIVFPPFFYVVVIILIISSFSPTPTAAVSCVVGHYCPYGLPEANANLIAYYSFWPDDRLVDRSDGVTTPGLGVLTAVSTSTYQANCQWTTSHCATISGTNYYQIPSVNLGQYSVQTGFSVCTWFMYASTTYTSARIFEFISSSNDKVIAGLYGASTTLSFEMWSNGNYDQVISSGFTTPFAIVTGTWYHLCMCNVAKTWKIYINSRLLWTQNSEYQIPSTTLNSNFIGHSNDGGVQASYISIDEFRIYNTMLTQDQVSSLYVFKSIQCPVGTFQNKTDQSSCMWCADQPNALYQPQIGATKCQNRVQVGMHSPNASTLLSSDNSLAAYYPFSVSVPGKDMSGVTGTLGYDLSITFSTANSAPWTYGASAQFTGTSCAVRASYGLDLMSLIPTTGISIAFWIMIPAGSPTARNIFFIGNNAKPFIMAQFNAFTTNSILYQWYASASNYNQNTVGSITADVWLHVTFVIAYPTWKTYVNSVLISTYTLTYPMSGSTSPGHLYIGSDGYCGTSLGGYMAEFRVYSKSLSDLEVKNVFWFRAYYCQAGMGNSLYDQGTCLSCPPNTYQSNIGGTTCLACQYAYNTDYGSIICPSTLTCNARTTFTSSAAISPGQAEISSGSTYLTFGCPPGMFHQGINRLNRLTDGCSFSLGTACTPNTCCIWMSSVSDSNYPPAFGFDISATNFLHSLNYRVNEFVAIDLLNVQYVSHILLFDRSSCCCDRTDDIVIYVGNNLVVNSAKTTPPKQTDWLNQYPLNDNRNTLCAVVTTSSRTYRNPLSLTCKTWGRYIYIVHANTVNYINLGEIMVFGRPPCSECQPGSYSNGVYANVKCTSCPTGTYQSGVGMTTCQACPTGTFQTSTGQAYCNFLTPPGAFSQSTSDIQTSANTYLMAYYTFFVYSMLVDTSGMLGSITIQKGDQAYLSNCQWLGAECLDLSSGTTGVYASLPSVNLGAMNPDTGFSVCMWYYWYKVVNTNNNTLFEFSIPGIFSFSVKYTAPKLYVWVQSPVKNISISQAFENLLAPNTWNHVCITGSSWTGTIYENGVMTGTFSFEGLINQAMTSVTLGAASNGLNKAQVLLDEVRIYTKQLTVLDVGKLFLYRIQSCFPGSYQDKFNQDMCKPCDIGYSQSSPGQTLCIPCSYATSTGTSNCASNNALMSSDILEPSGLPGMAYYQNIGGNVLKMPCPGGTSNSVFTRLSPWTAGATVSNVSIAANKTAVACSGSAVCLWITNTDGISATSPFDADANTAFTVMGNGYFIGIDLSTSRMVDTVVLYFASRNWSSVSGSFVVYVGNTLYTSALGKTSTLSDSSSIYKYPISTQLNTLCYNASISTQTSGDPFFINCLTSGRYMYIVTTSSIAVTLSEIIVLGTPVCTRCGAGYFSSSDTFSTTCCTCPAGMYQPASGSTFCYLCPPGTYQYYPGSSTCSTCNAGSNQPDYGKSFCNYEFPSWSYSISAVQAMSTGLIGYYTFNSSNRLGDSTGLMSPLTVTGNVAYDTLTSGPYTLSEYVVFNEPNSYMSLPPINIGSMRVNNGFTFCIWLYVNDRDRDQRVWEARSSTSSTAVVVYMYIGTRGITVILQDWLGSVILAVADIIGSQYWNHACFTAKDTLAIGYFNGIANQIPNQQNLVLSNANMIYHILGMGITTATHTPEPYFSGAVDDVRMYNVELTPTQIRNVYAWRPYTPISFQTVPAVVNCAQTPYKLTDTITSVANVPGSVSLQYDTSSVIFECPSGSYLATASKITSLTYNSGIFVLNVGSTIASCTSTSCISIPSQVAVTGTNLVDADKTADVTIQGSNRYIMIDLVTAKYIDSVIVFDTFSVDSYKTNGFSVYAGNVSYQPAVGTTLSDFNTVNVYPVSTQQNVLCYKDNGSLQGYRNPITVRCPVTARYIYLVAGSTNALSISELVVTQAPVCTLCPAGTFSVNTEPNAKCSPCPVGQFQGSSGMSFCSRCPPGTFQDTAGSSVCKYCSLGFYQPQYGRSFCVTDLNPALILPISTAKDVSSNLIAYYNFRKSNPTLDLSGVTGNLGISGTPVYNQQDNGPFPNIDYANWEYSNFYYVIPAINYLTMYSTNGFSICFWAYPTVLDILNIVWGSGGAAHTMQISSSKYGFLIYFNNGLRYNIEIINPIQTNVWYHICVTFKQTVVQAYVNGILVNEQTILFQFTMMSEVNTYIGYGFSSGSDYFKGYITDFRIYNKVINASFVSDIYNWRPYFTGYYTPIFESELGGTDLVAYYTFDAEQRLKDSSSVTGDLTPTGTNITYQSDCQWRGAECMVLGTMYNYMTVPPLNMAGLSGCSVCMWYMFYAQSTYGTLFYMSDDKFQNWVYVQQNGVASVDLGFTVRSDATTVVNYINNGASVGVWRHLCVTVNGAIWRSYINGVENAVITGSSFPYTLWSRVYIGYWYNGPTYNFTGMIDEFRVYKKALTPAQVTALYNWRPQVLCPMGTYQDDMTGATCKACGIGQYQGLPGQTGCLTCNNGLNVWYGGIACPSSSSPVSVLPVTVLSDTAGMYSLNFSSKSRYLTFNAPSGYYTNTKQVAQRPITDMCAVSDPGVVCTGSGSDICCVWASSAQGASVSYAVDGLTTTSFAASASGSNQFIAVDFKSTSQYIDSVVIFDAQDSNMVANNGLSIYIGNTLYGTGTTPSVTPVSYPVQTQANTLCASLSPQDTGYRYPKTVSCKMTGQYLYIVMATSTLGLVLPEFAVLSSSPGTPCLPGSYSSNTMPTIDCSLCPAGTYSTGTGMTSADACTNCPLGQYATGMGGSSQSVCTSC